MEHKTHSLILSLGLFLNTGSDLSLPPFKWISDHRNFFPFSFSSWKLSLLAFLHFPLFCPECLVLVAELVVGLEVEITPATQTGLLSSGPSLLFCLPLPWIPYGMHRIAHIRIVLQNINTNSVCPTCLPLSCQCQKWNGSDMVAYFIALFGFPLLLTLNF